MHCSSQLSSGMHPQRQPSRRWPQNSQNHHPLPRHWPSILILECSSRLWDTRKHRLPLANCSNQLSFRMHRPRPMSRKWPQSCQNNRLLPRRWPSVLNLGCNSRRWDTRKRRLHLANCSSQFPCNMHPPRPTSHKWPQNSQTNHSMPHHWPSILILDCSSRRWDTRKHRQRLGHRPRQPSRKRPQNFQTNHRWLSVRSAQTGLLTGPSLRKPKHRPGKKCLREHSF